MNRAVLLIGIPIAAILVAIFVFALGEDPSEIKSPLVGNSAPTFALKEVGTGRTVDLEQFRGKPVVINFWATWCGPCYVEHPTLVAAARELDPKVQFLGVVFDDSEDKIMNFLRDRGSSYPTLVDVAGKTAIAYGVGGVPETFFLDPSGKIVAKYNGPLSPELLRENVMKAMPR